MTTTIERMHSMPFGAQLDSDGVHFQLWAPGAERVDLYFSTGPTNSHGRARPMSDAGDGWYRLTVPEAGSGTEYYYRINGEARVPDPASRFQPRGVHGPSEVIDPRDKRWHDAKWRGRPWEEAIIYELHIGTFTPAGNFAAVRKQLGYLAELGVTAVQLMPVAEFPGHRNWGYDGVLPFSPTLQYGRPEHLKALVEAAHQAGLMVFLDVVYNHFGPEGNYLHLYAPQFFTDRHSTPWGDAINFDGENSHWVRQFFIHNALYWLEEFNLDGLRFDAVHAIVDDSEPDFLSELATTVRQAFERPIHLILENDDNQAHYLARDDEGEPRYYTAQFNEDIHHALHVLLTNESEGYYQDYATDPIGHLGRCLSEGFAYQGDISPYRGHQARGEPSTHLPLTAFVSFLQNHDQVGNRAFGERLISLTRSESLRAATAILLLAPSPPFLFMGQEWACEQPFLYFCDFNADLAQSVTEGRRREFARFPAFREPVTREHIPDPISEQTFMRSRLNWTLCRQLNHQRWLDLHRELLHLRRENIIPRLTRLNGSQAAATRLSDSVLAMEWTLGDGATLDLLANLDDNKTELDCERPPGSLLYASHAEPFADGQSRLAAPWSVYWYLATPELSTPSGR